jgi:hypothetical protein
MMCIKKWELKALSRELKKEIKGMQNDILKTVRKELSGFERSMKQHLQGQQRKLTRSNTTSRISNSSKRKSVNNRETSENLAEI